ARGARFREPGPLPARCPLAGGRGQAPRLEARPGAAPPRLRPRGGRQAPVRGQEESAMTLDAMLDVPLVPSPEVVARRVAGEYLLVPVFKGAAQMDFIFTANEIGSLIFRLLDGRRDARTIARLVSQEYEVDEERAHAEVIEFLRGLVEARLARPAADTEGP